MSADHIVKKAQRKEGAMGLRKPATPSCLCALLANGEHILFFGFTQNRRWAAPAQKRTNGKQILAMLDFRCYRSSQIANRPNG
jgi:hypothetical protein